MIENSCELIRALRLFKLFFFGVSMLFDYQKFLFISYALIDQTGYLFNPFITEERYEGLFNLINFVERNLKNFVNSGFLPFSRDSIEKLQNLHKILLEGVVTPLIQFFQRFNLFEESHKILLKGVAMIIQEQKNHTEVLQKILVKVESIEKKQDK